MAFSFSDVFDTNRLRFPATWQPDAGLRVRLLTPRLAPYRVSRAARPVCDPRHGYLVAYESRHGLHGLEAVAPGDDRREATRRLRKLLAAREVYGFLDRAYAAAGHANDGVHTKRSPVAGNGVFARHALGRGDVLEDVSRPLVRYARVPKKNDPGYGHAVQVTRGWWLLLDHSLFYFLNHSCAPNVRLQMDGASVRVVTTRAIRAGQELLLDYGTVAFRDDPYAIQCTCGAKSCRGIVRGRR